MLRAVHGYLRFNSQSDEKVVMIMQKNCRKIKRKVSSTVSDTRHPKVRESSETMKKRRRRKKKEKKLNDPGR